MDYQDREAKALEMLNAPEPPAAEPAAPPAAPGGSGPGGDGGAAPGVLSGSAAGGAPPAAGGRVGGPAVAPAGASSAAGATPPAVPAGRPDAAGAAPGQPAAAPGAGISLWANAQPVPATDLQQLMVSNNIGGMEQLKGTLADADALYQVLDGKQPASALLEAVRLNYSPQVFFRVLTDMQAYLQRFAPPPGGGLPVPPGFPTLPAPVGGAPPAGAAQGNGNSNGNGAGDPGLAVRMTQLENNWQAQQRQNQMAAEDRQREAGFQAFMGRIRELGQKEGLDEEDVGNYAAAVATRINGDPQITGRLLQGKLNDIDRLFTEHHNSMLQWEHRRSERKLQQKNEKHDVQPRIATGGGPPAPVKPGKVDTSFEGRTARALEMLK